MSCCCEVGSWLWAYAPPASKPAKAIASTPRRITCSEFIVFSPIRLFLASPPHLKNETLGALESCATLTRVSSGDLRNVTILSSTIYGLRRAPHLQMRRTPQRKTSSPGPRPRSAPLWVAFPCRSSHEPPAAKWRDRWLQDVRTANCRRA